MRALRNQKNNKGFSLVELIIVIAIMAILVGTLAPQYLRYVERARVATDEQLLDDLQTAFEVLAADPDAELVDEEVYEIASTADSAVITATQKGSKVIAVTAFRDIVGTDIYVKVSENGTANETTTIKYALKSNAYKKGTVSIKLEQAGDKSATPGRWIVTRTLVK